VNDGVENKLSIVECEESIDMIKIIVVICHFILSTMQGSWLVLLPILATHWVTKNAELSMEGD
jgi:hypothetical protein